MANILFDIYPVASHYNATFKIAKHLQQRGHRVFYVGPGSYQESIAAQGFGFFPGHPVEAETFSGGSTVDPPSAARQSFVAGFVSRIKYARMRRRTAPETNEQEEIIKATRPDLVILDVSYISHFIDYYRLGVRLAIIQTKVSPRKAPGVPPPTSSLIPGDGWWSRLLMEVAWGRCLLRKQAFRYGMYIKKLGADPYSLLRIKAAAAGFSFAREVDSRTAFQFRVKNIPQFILSPRDFEFTPRPLTNQYYMGPVVDLNRKETLYDWPYEQAIAQVMRQKAARPDLRILYCSLGSIGHVHYKNTLGFFFRVIEACQPKENWVLLLSVGEETELGNFGRYANVHVFQKVPQLDLLRRADAMITHGGMQSITECVCQEVPMLVYPLNAAWDQPGNAARVVFHGLGLRGDIRHDTPTAIRQKLERILREESYRRNVRAMRRKYLESNHFAEGILQLERLLG